MPCADAFTPADALRLQTLSDLHEWGDRDLTPAEYAEWTALVERWQHACRLLAECELVKRQTQQTPT